MLKDITIGRYMESDSFLHRLDPRTKIIDTILLSITVLSCSNLILFVVPALIITAAVKSSHLPFRYVINGLKPIRFIILFTVIFNIFTVNGTVLWHWKSLHITYEGIEFAAIVALRFILFATGASLLTLTTSPISLTDGFARLMRPLKKISVPVDDIAMIISITLRFIPLFADEAERIMKAQKSRGADFNSGKTISRLRSVIPITIPLFLSVFKRADELSLAMDSRCYGKGIRNPRKKSYFGINDLFLNIFLVIICGILILFEFYH